MAHGGWLDEHLSRLEHGGLIRPARLDPELEYAFRHGLFQDAAYGSLVRNQRQTLHRHVADTLESLYPDRRVELAETLAHHLAMAGQSARAFEYYMLAADRAASAYAHDETIQHIQSALRLPGLDIPLETRLPLLERVGDAHNALGHLLQAVASYQLAVGQWDTFGSGDSLITIRYITKIVKCPPDARWRVLHEQSEAGFVASLPYRDRLIDELGRLEDAPPSRQIVTGYVALAEDASTRGSSPDLALAERWARMAVDAAERLGDPLALCASLSALNDLHASQSLFRERHDVALRQLALLESPGLAEPRARLRALQDVAGSFLSIGDFQGALDHLPEIFELARLLQSVGTLNSALMIQTYAMYRLDRWDDTLKLVDEALALRERYPHEQLGVPCFEIALGAAVHALRGDLAASADLRDQSYRLMEQVSGDPSHWLRHQHI